MHLPGLTAPLNVAPSISLTANLASSISLAIKPDIGFTGNIGEWSEVHALSTIVIDGVLDLTSILQHEGESRRDVKVKKAIKTFGDHEIHFTLNTDQLNPDLIEVSKHVYQKPFVIDATGRKKIKNNGKTVYFTRSRRLFISLKDTVLKSMKEKHRDGAFGCTEKILNDNGAWQTVTETLKDLMITKCAAGTLNKCDLEVEYEPGQGLNIPKRQRFSAKSKLGAKASLLNGSRAVVFRRQIIGQMTEKLRREINSIDTKHKYSERWKKMKEHGLSLGETKFLNEKFRDNLAQIGEDAFVALVPAISETFYNRENSEDKKVAQICINLFKNLPDYLRKHYDNNMDLLVGHVKKFLRALNTYMRPSRYTLNPVTEIDGGYLEIGRTGKLRGYSNDAWAIEEYLFNNTIWDTPSGSHCEITLQKETKTTKKVGRKIFEIYQEGGEFFINFPMSIRIN